MGAKGTIGRLRDKVRGSLRRTGGATARGGSGDDRGLAPNDDGIVVSYAPEHDGEPDPGEVVWAWVPFEDDPSQGKDRPVLVLGHAGSKLACVQLSSKDHSGRGDAHEWVPVGRGGWDRSGRESYADASRLLRLAPRTVRREGAALHEDRFHEVLDRVRTLHGWQG